MLRSRGSASSAALAWSGGAIFVLSLGYFLYSYLVRFGVSVESRPAAGAVAANVALFGIFALHHSLLARPGIKARLHAAIPAHLERSVYTWTASVLFLLVCRAWQFVPGTIYEARGAARWLGYTVQLVGLVLTLRGAGRLDVLELAGIRQALASPVGTAPRLETKGPYALVRHPVYLGWALLVFGTPEMTMTRFVFAAVSTAYVAAAIPFEERGLLALFGPEYRAYQRKVRWRMFPYLY